MTDIRLNKASCVNCAHSQEVAMPGQIVRQLVCARFPPTVLATPQGLISTFPPVGDSMTCGEHKVIIQ